MLEKLGSRAIAAPFGLVLVLTCVLSLAVAPMLQAAPHDISLAIVNLDEGTETPAGTINAGAVLESQMTGEDSEEAQATTEAMAKLASLQAAQAKQQAEAAASGASPDAAAAAGTNASTAVTAGTASETAGSEAKEGSDTGTASTTSSMADALRWQAIDDEELQNQLADNQVFGGIVIPADFTAQQLAAKSDSSAKPQITVYVNMGKNPQVASMLQSAMTQALAAAGIDANVEQVNNADVGGGMMSNLMVVQMMVMPMFIMTLAGSIILALLTWKKDVWGLRARSPWLAAVGQVALIAALSACIAACALCIDTIAGGLSLPFGDLFWWLWLGSACVMLAFVGLVDLNLPIGALIGVCVFALGMGTAMLPPEMMPPFWADWVFPWAPQAHLGQGVRAIVYCGQTPGSADTMPLLAFAIVGIMAALAAAGIAQAKTRKA